MDIYNRVYEIVKMIPKGRVMTYGQIALLLGNIRLSRVVGWALHVNPDPKTIPCHRVVNRYGEPSKAFVFGGIDVQRQLLEKEGIIFDENNRVKPCFFLK